MAVYEIPLSGFPEQFEIEINGATWLFRVRWNNQLERWAIDIGRSADEWLIRNLALVAGQNLLMQYGYMKLGFELHMQVDGKPEAEAEWETLGNPARLYAVTSDE